MRKCYKAAGAWMIAAGLIGQVNAQTQFGVAAGTMGEGHVYFGEQAGSTTTAPYNTFIGANSGQFHATGEKGTFVGYKSGSNNNQGVDNTLIGAYSGNNLTGYENTFIGSGSGKDLIGYQNILFGKKAGEKAAGNFNIYIGNGVGYQSTGDGNVLIGNLVATMFNTKSNNNTVIGNEAGVYIKDCWDNSFFGASAGRQNKTGSYNSFFCNGAGYDNETGTYISCLGYNSGTGTSGNLNTFLGAFTGTVLATNLTNATAIGANAKVTASNSLVLGNQVNVGIGMSAPAYQLQLSTPYAAKLGSSVWAVWSDERLKKDISDFKDGLSLLKQIKPVWFRYNGVAGTKTDKKFVGIIAQEMQKIAPYTIGSAIYQDSLGSKTEYLDYDANAVTYILINSVKEQQEVIDQQEEEIKSLSDRLSKSDKIQLELIARLEKLEKLSTSSGPNLNGSNDNSAARIEQNAPNGFSGNTSIQYYIPQDVKTAVINIYTVDGIKAGSYTIKERGQGELSLSASEFKSGIHVYDLVTDGKSAGAKKMLVK